MTGIQLLIVAVCGLVIGLAIYLLVRSLGRMLKGRCCGGCAACPVADQCRARSDEVQRKAEER